MKAALLERVGELRVTDLPEPVLGTGEVLVDVHVSPVLSYARELVSGLRAYPLELPAVLGGGAIGRVRAVGPDSTRLSPGEWVYCDPTLRARDNRAAPDIMLQGIIAPSEAAMRLHHYHRHGSWAEVVRVPTENVTALGMIASEAAERWSLLGRLLVPYGGLLAGNLMAGETVLVNGATGAFGSAGVAAALAMGASLVVATGRNEARLAELGHRYGARVVPVVARGDEKEDGARFRNAAGGPLDLVLDLLPPTATAAQVQSAISCVRANGRVILMGGLRANAPLSLSYDWIMRNNITLRGQWMYPPAAPRQMVSMIRAGLVDLGAYNVTSFALAEVDRALAHAAEHAGPFEVTVLEPRSSP